MDNPIFFIIYLIIAVIISIAVVFMILKKKNKKIEEVEEIEEEDVEITFEDLLKMAKDRHSTSKDLLSALMLYDDNFKIKDNPELSLTFFRLVLNHRNRNKELFDFFHNQIKKNNANFREILDKIEREALK